MLNGPHKLLVPRDAASAESLKNVSSAYPSRMPFETALSFEPLISYWRDAAARDDPAISPLLPSVEAHLQKHPEVTGRSVDPDHLADHEGFLQLLMSPLFPAVYRDEIAAAATLPFEYRSVYPTPAFERLFTQERGIISGRVNLDLRTFTYGKIISAYLHILRNVYGADVPFDYPVTFTTDDPATGLDLHFKVVTDLRFVRIDPTGTPPDLSDETIRSLLANITDVSGWMRLIPPSAFEFYGVSIIHAHDVTEERMVGLLERDLVEEGRLVGRSALPDVEDHLRTFLRMPQIELGLAALDGNDFYLLNEPSHSLVDTFFTRSTRYDASAIRGSIFERSLEGSMLHVVEDLHSVRGRSTIEDDMLQWGVRNVVAAPLDVRNDRVGVVYLWSTEPSSLAALNVMKLLEVVPIFATAVRRARDEMRNRVQSVIVGRYTAIHPSVEWRFRKAALRSIQKQEREGTLEVEPIVFENVHPLFAATDIRASSEHRNEAVQHDLLHHLELAEELLREASVESPIALFHHLLARTGRHKKALADGLASNDEAAVRDFLQSDLEPILLNLKGLSESLDEAIERYRKAADPQVGTLYRRSQAFDSSVQKINDTISEYLDAEQTAVQGLISHYFEKHQTDGVDFTMYVGSALLENDDFDPLFVNVLRLWQLMVMCGIAARLKPLKQHLGVPLDTTYLVLVQNTPINIRYRFDETRFDVDGPHHVRFEIMKQRVEKACIRGTDQRVTQPDRLAIIYSQDREAHEYTAYLDYLQQRGFISPDIEEVELDDLQGMKGLRALRVTVGADSANELPSIEPSHLPEAVGSLDL